MKNPICPLCSKPLNWLVDSGQPHALACSGCEYIWTPNTTVPAAMPPLEVGDWVVFNWGARRSVVIEQTNVLNAKKGCESVLEIRKANGHVWTREPR